MDAVKNSAIAGQAMAELAATLPNTGGAVAFFAGDNDMATFGAQLASFGVSMKNYSKSVSGLDSDAVANSAIAGKTLVELQIPFRIPEVWSHSSRATTIWRPLAISWFPLERR